MIRRSYIFLDRVARTTEKNIWKQGIKGWDDFFNAEKIRGISGKAKAYHNRMLRKASHELYDLNSKYFTAILPSSEMWRLYTFFSDEAVFLDIETSGVERYDDITVVGLFDGIDTKVMIKGVNLDFNALRRVLMNYRLIVTFNGGSFDIPFIKKRYPGVIPDIPHIDIRHACDRVGLNGGLKEIEKRLEIKRNKIIEKIYGGDPILLWKMFRATGDRYYLNLLVEYNEDDVINLKTIADRVIPILEEGTIRCSSSQTLSGQ